MAQKEASKGVPHETRRVPAKDSAAVGGLAAAGKADEQSPCEDCKTVGKRSVKTAVRRLLPSLSPGVRDPSPMCRNSQQFESVAPEAEGKNPPATSTPSSSYNVLGSIISTSTAEPIVERLVRRAPAKEAPSKDTTTGEHQQGDAEKPRKSLKEALLSKMMALFGGSGLSAAARDTATAAPMPSTSRGSVEPLVAKRPRGSREQNLQGPGSLFGGLPAVSDSIETGPSQAPRPSKRPATGFHGPSASGATHYWQQATPGSGMPRGGPGPSWCFLAPPAESGTSSQDGVSPLQGELIVEDVEMEDLTDAFDESLNEQGPLTDYKGTYVVTDTNIFLSNLSLLKRILLPDTGNEDMVLCVSWMAIQELDSIKTKKKGPLSSSAASAIMFIYQALSTKNPRLRGQTVVEARRKDDVLPKDGCSINDDHFLHWCLEFKKQGNKVLLLSNDCNLRNKAMINSIDTMSADQIEKKLGPPTTKEGHKQTPSPKSSIEQQKPSALLSQQLELRPCKFSSRSSQKLPLPPDVLQKQKDASKEASATSNTSACDVSPQVPVRDTILMEVREILRESLNLTLKSELESAFGTLWLRVVEIKPPWTEESALQCILRHWISLTGTAFSKSTLKPIISALLSKLSKNPGSSEVLQITDLAIQLCSEMQCHYPQLAEDVARLEKLSGDLLGLQQAAAAGSAARRHDSDGKKETSARPRPPPLRNPGRSMPINHRLVNLNKEPTVDYVHRPPHVILMASINEARYQAEYRAEEERKRNPDAPLPPHIPPGRPHIINRFPLRPPMEAVKRRLELHRQQPLPLPPPPPENTPPVALFQDSWSVINDYCLLNELDKGRENLVGLAEALIEALTELLRTLRHESIPADKTWRVDLDEMLDFLMEPRHKNLLAVGKLQIMTLHNSLAQCALDIMSPNFKPSP
ncbi:uncharacterized protein Swt1 isoform X2 [Dermacentor albipictus]|uniref:uncharacterized protein Swt1 isoform X2 n=1 Tax=Dermacentor albipictus TaxID=60249 RepID=UPI0031FCF910